MTKKNNQNKKNRENKDIPSQPTGIPSEYHNTEPNQPSPYISSMAMIECKSPQDLVRAFGSMQKDTLKVVKEITSKTVEVTKQYVDANVECLIKQIETVQGIVTDLYGILRQIADVAKDNVGKPQEKAKSK